MIQRPLIRGLLLPCLVTKPGINQLCTWISSYSFIDMGRQKLAKNINKLDGSDRTVVWDCHREHVLLSRFEWIRWEGARSGQWNFRTGHTGLADQGNVNFRICSSVRSLGSEDVKWKCRCLKENHKFSEYVLHANSSSSLREYSNQRHNCLHWDEHKTEEI